MEMKFPNGAGFRHLDCGQGERNERRGRCPVHQATLRSPEVRPVANADVPEDVRIRQHRVCGSWRGRESHVQRVSRIG